MFLFQGDRFAAGTQARWCFDAARTRLVVEMSLAAPAPNICRRIN
jgi:hypothetical protein